MIHAVIPTRYHPPELDRLLVVLEEDEVAVHLLDSEVYEHKIHRMWNAGVNLSVGAKYIAVLNDDIEILPGTLPLMANVLDQQPTIGIVYPHNGAPLTKLPETIEIQLTEGSARVGGMTGFCFMFRTDAGFPPFDEGYHWWYGDDAFEEAVRTAGYGVGRINLLPLHHIPSGSARFHEKELRPLIAADASRWERRGR